MNIEYDPNSPFQRSQLLLGIDVMRTLAAQRVILFGLGGVGSWCAECLIRSGIHHLTLVDFDTIHPTNINRQLPATTSTIGLSKVDVLQQRFVDINPNVHITPIHSRYTAEDREKFQFNQYDIIIDAIDSLPDKADLILSATALPHIHFVSSMGAARKVDPTRIRTSDFWKVSGDPLARALRSYFKKNQLFPAHKFPCVYSDENMDNQVDTSTILTTLPTGERMPNGTIAHITAIFGCMLAALALQPFTNHKKE